MMVNGLKCTRAVAALGFLTLLASSATAQSPTVATVKLPNDGKLIYAPVTLNSRSLLFIVDTGSSNTLLDVSLADEVSAIQSPKEAEEAHAGAVVPLHLDSLDMTDTTGVRFFDFAGFRRFSGKDVRGLLGMRALRKYRLEFDFDQSILRISKTGEMPDQSWGNPIFLEFDNRGRPHLNMRINKEWHSFMIDTGANIT